jgi:nucleotide-binding universal stress UspA family protein
MPGITVGVDGSDNSLRALEWAMKEAGLRHAALTVLTVNPVAVSYWTENPIILPEDKAEEEKIRKAAEEAVAKAASQSGESPPPSVTVRAISGIPAEELIKASGDAELLAVGARGGGGFARLLLGSVSSQIVQHAACPVTVVPAAR